VGRTPRIQQGLKKRGNASLRGAPGSEVGDRRVGEEDRERMFPAKLHPVRTPGRAEASPIRPPSFAALASNAAYTASVGGPQVASPAATARVPDRLPAW